MLTILGYSCALLLGAMCFFGVLATRHIDPKKVASELERKDLMYNTEVPEKFLTATGKRWAFWRNVCALLGFLGLIAYGSAMALLGNWK